MIEPPFFMEIMSIVVLVIVFLGTCIETRTSRRKKGIFIALTMVSLVVQVVDAITWLPLAWNNHIPFLFVLTMITFFAPYAAGILFFIYMYVHISEKTKITNVHVIISVAYSALVMIFMIFACFKGWFFTLPNGVYTIGKHYALYYEIYIVVLVYMVTVITFYHKKIGWHDVIATVLYIIFPVIAMVLDSIYPSLFLSVPSMGIEVLIIYVMLQAENANVLIKESSEISKIAHMDELTGLPNRLAYSKVYDKVGKNGNVGVLFCDINGLKYTNDSFGHKEGDCLICNFSQKLLDCFDKDTIFRVSGDEFVVLQPDVAKEDFLKQVDKLNEMLNSDKFPVACCGEMFGKKSELRELLIEAEHKMYICKENFYKKYPQYKRVK